MVEGKRIMGCPECYGTGEIITQYMVTRYGVDKCRVCNGTGCLMDEDEDVLYHIRVIGKFTSEVKRDCTDIECTCLHNLLELGCQCGAMQRERSMKNNT
jgi:Ribonuclease G/E